MTTKEIACELECAVDRARVCQEKEGYPYAYGRLEALIEVLVIRLRTEVNQ
jgi:hypothetical protein